MKYKRIKKLVPFCEICDKEIFGNGSVISPYYCKCGEYKYNQDLKEYVLINWSFKK